MARLLFDALTPKQARIAAHLYLEGRRRGLEVAITCRRYMHLEDMLKAYGVPHRCFGGHGATAREKLLAGVERQRELVEAAEAVDGMLGFPSPEAARVVFGLGKPVAVLNDTPHASHVNRLVLPLAEVLVAPGFIPAEAWRPYCPRRLVTFDGVFEYMWTSRFSPDPSPVRALGLEEGRYVVFRPEEEKAAYYAWNSRALRMALMEEARRAGYVVVNVPRYPDQLVEGALNLTEAVDHLQLAWFSAAVVTGGSTMAVEAALLGVPAVSYFPAPLHVEGYLRGLGLPFVRCGGLEECVRALRWALSAGRASPAKMEDPIEAVFEAAESLWPGGP